MNRALISRQSAALIRIAGNEFGCAHEVDYAEILASPARAKAFASPLRQGQMGFRQPL